MHRIAMILLGCVLAATPVAANLERELEQTYRGAWALTRVDVYSDCTGFFTNNDIAGVRVSSRGNRRFEPGELVRIEKVSLKSERIELYAVLEEPVLMPRRDGPFTLFDERTCKAELRVEIPRGAGRARDAGPIHGLIEDVLATFNSREAASRSSSWNQRVREPLPADYEVTLARYEIWKVEQANARIAEVQDASLDEASRIASRLSDNPDYLQGFAAGTDSLRSWRAPTCSLLTSTTLSSVQRQPPPPPRGVDDPRAFANGFRDGQALVFHLEIARRARSCFLPLPPLRP